MALTWWRWHGGRYAPSDDTVAQVISTHSFQPFVPLDSSADFCIDGSAGLTGGARGSAVILFWSLALNAALFALYLLRMRRVHVLHDAAFNKQTLTAADFAVMIKGASNNIRKINRLYRSYLAFRSRLKAIMRRGT